MDASRIIFLGGSPRSGTTLVQNMLDSHPAVLGGPEFLHLQDIVGLLNKMRISVRKEWINLFCDDEQLDTEMRTLILRMLLPFADRHNAERLSEKTPENILVFPELMKLFPEARFIFVNRDPRAIVASQLEVGKRAKAKGEEPAHFTRDVGSSIDYVRKCINAGFRAHAANPDQLYVLRYEQLVSDAETGVKDLCRYLDLPFAEQMLHPGEQSHLGEAAITTQSQEIWYDKATYNSNPNTQSLEKWKKQLSSAEQLAIHHAFADHAGLKSQGYVIDPPDDQGIATRFSYTSSKLSAKIRRKMQSKLGITGV